MGKEHHKKVRKEYKRVMKKHGVDINDSDSRWKHEQRFKSQELRSEEHRKVNDT